MSPIGRQSYETVSAEIRQKQLEVAEAIINLDRNEIKEALRLISEHQTIYFIGSELSMAVCRLLQVKLMGMGKNVYT